MEASTTITTAERLESAALDLFIERGYDGVSIRDVARKVGVTVGTAHYHFPSKDALYRASLDRLTRRALDEGRRMLEEGKWIGTRFADGVAVEGARRVIQMWLDLQTSVDPERQRYADEYIIDPAWRSLSKSLSLTGEVTTERQLAAMSFVGGVILSALLRDEQLERLLSRPAAEVRALWRDVLLRLLAAD